MSDYKLVELMPVEKFFYYGSLFGDEFVNGIAITRCKSSELDDATVKEAMFYLYKRHPLLRAHIEVDEKKPNCFYFAIPLKHEKTVDEMKFERCILKSRVELIKELERFSVQTLEYHEKCLLWRLEVITFSENDCENAVFIITIPMNCTDGINITCLCIELVNILNSLLNKDTCVEMTEHLDLLDNSLNLIKMHNLADEEYWENYEKFRKNANIVPFLLPNVFKSETESGYKMDLLALDVDSTQNIVLFAKEHKIKVNSVLVSAVFYSLKIMYEEKGLKMPKDVSVYVMVSLRIRLEPNIDFSHTRTCTSAILLELEYPDFGKYENFFDDCKFVDRMVPKKIKERSMFDWILNEDSKLIDETYKTDPQKLNAILDNQRLCDVVISNNGTWVYDRKKVINGPIKIEELHYGDSLKSFPTMNIPFILHMHTFNERLMIQLSSNRSKISSISSDRFLFIFKKVLENFS